MTNPRLSKLVAAFFSLVLLASACGAGNGQAVIGEVAADTQAGQSQPPADDAVEPVVEATAAATEPNTEMPTAEVEAEAVEVKPTAEVETEAVEVEPAAEVEEEAVEVEPTAEADEVVEATEEPQEPSGAEDGTAPVGTTPAETTASEELPETAAAEAATSQTTPQDESTERGNDVSGDDAALTTAVAVALLQTGDLPVGFDVECMAASMVQGLGGAEAMEANYGLTAETIGAGSDINDMELDQATAVAVADGMMGCGMANLMVNEMLGDGMSREDAQCLVMNLDQDALRDLFASELMNAAEATALSTAAETNLFTSMFGAISECAIDPTSLGL